MTLPHSCRCQQDDELLFFAMTHQFRRRSLKVGLDVYTFPPIFFFFLHLLAKVEAFSVGLGPKLLSYRAADGKCGLLKGKLSGPFSSPESVEEKIVEPETKEVKKATSIWAWGKKKEEKKEEVVVEKKEPEGVEVRWSGWGWVRRECVAGAARCHGVCVVADVGGGVCGGDYGGVALTVVVASVVVVVVVMLVSA